MRAIHKLIAVWALGGFALSGPAVAKDEATPAIDPAAIQVLERMGAYLRTINTFGVRASDTIDEVLETGQKIQLSSDIQLQVKRPNFLRANIETDRAASRQLFYNGKTFTLFSPSKKFYATVPAKPTIGEVLTNIEAKYGIAFPLADLYRWGNDPDDIAAIKAARFVGASKIDGQLTNHYAFRQEGIDWQIWIAQGDAPLPVKYVITTTDEPEQPQYTVNLKWDTGSNPDDAMFTFVPAEDDSAIAIVPLDEVKSTK